MMKQMKRMTAVLCSAALTLSLTACSSSDSSVTNSEVSSEAETLTGQVTEIDGVSVTLLLGELETQEMQGGPGSEGGGQSPSEDESAASGGNDSGAPDLPDGEKPGGDSDSGETMGKPDAESSDGDSDSAEAPEKPDGASDSPEASEKPDGGKPDGDSDSPEASEKPDGGKPDGDSDSPDSTVSSDAEAPSEDDMGGGEMPSEQPGGGGGMARSSVFTAGDETVTLDLSDAVIWVESGTETTEGTMDDIAVDDILVVEFSDGDTAETVVTVKDLNGGMGDMGSGNSAGGDFGGSGEVTQGTSANTLDEDGEYSDAAYTSTGDDENALRVDGATVTLTDITVEKTGGATSNTEDGDFYGMNAALLATNGANVTIKGATVNSSAQNGNGVFSYGEGTVVTISDSVITTTADNSGGIQTTGGGATNASNLTVTTSGSSAAAIRSDRGGGTVSVDGGSYTSNGYNSPAVYSTADITVKNATLTANNSEALVIEGQNSITLENCDVSGNMSDTEGTSSDENVHNVMIYQSMSGDADVGTSTFSMTGGTLTSNNGDMIYITNTHCILTLSGVELVNKDSEGYLLRVVGNSASRGWGNAGSNGGQVEFTADGQTLEGDIIVDTISTMNMTLSGNSTFTGTINIVENEEGGSAVSDNAVVTIEKGSTWTLTGDCTITSLENEGAIDYNGYTITLADGTVLQ